MLGLNREKLKRDRREHYEALHLLAQLELPQSEKARQKLERATAPDAEFSAMATAAIGADFDGT